MAPSEAKGIIGTLQLLAPGPNAANLQALTKDLEDKFETIPAQQSPDHGFSGMVMAPEIYALCTLTPWSD
jgi:hypothetical protein